MLTEETLIKGGNFAPQSDIEAKDILPEVKKVMSAIGKSFENMSCVYLSDNKGCHPIGNLIDLSSDQRDIFLKRLIDLGRQAEEIISK